MASRGQRNGSTEEHICKKEGRRKGATNINYVLRLLHLVAVSNVADVLLNLHHIVPKRRQHRTQPYCLIPKKGININN
jgi:hypothetical protein